MLQKLEDMHVQTASTADSHEEKYRGALIRYLGLSDLPYLLFGRDFSGFSELFYTQRGNFLLASSSLLALKSALDQLEEEKSWGSTPSIHTQLSEEMTEKSLPKSKYGKSDSPR